MDVSTALSVLVGMSLGGGIAFLLLRSRSAAASAVLNERLESRARQIEELKAAVDSKEAALAEQREAVANLRARESELSTRVIEERKLSEEKLNLLQEAQRKLSDAFKALSSEALKNNNQSFLDLAKTTLAQFQQVAKGDLEKRQIAIDELVKPVRESLDKVQQRIQDMEKERTGASEGLKQQVQTLLETGNQLRDETVKLAQALKSPTVRGRWGEIQLRRVVELAGMLEHCDFYEQETATDETGRKLRPDMLIRLPGGKTIVVDAKAPLTSYLESMETEAEELRKAKLDDHARQIRSHVTALSRKGYLDQFESTPEFVILFLPGEMFFSAALQQDPTLIEMSVEQGVVIATPTTLIALLRAISYGWRQEHLAENAKHISELGRELYKRVSDLGGHLTKLGSNLRTAVDSYNKTIGTLETRVLPQARKFKELKTAPENVEIDELAPIDQAPRTIMAQELLKLPET